MSLTLSNPQQVIAECVNFLRNVFTQQGKKTGVIAVSGGIDSAVSLSLLVQALGVDQVIPVLLPYGDQDMSDGWTVIRHHGIRETQVRTINIQPLVDEATKMLELGPEDTFRLGNLKARARMMCVFDLAKAHDGLVCGTENKSEHYLGYFTRFGDAASDIEPLTHLYKTQVRQVAEALRLPEIFLTKAPSAGLWKGQTDEEEMGFTYTAADQVLDQLVDRQVAPENIRLPGVSSEVVQKVISQVDRMAFKLHVPYYMKTTPATSTNTE